MQFRSLFRLKNNLPVICNFSDILLFCFCMATKCLTLFQETRIVFGRNNTQHEGTFGKCKPIECLGYIKSMKIKDTLFSPFSKQLSDFF